MVSTAPDVTVEIEPDVRAFYVDVYGDSAQHMLDKLASRPSMPDIDLDFDQQERARVSDWIRGNDQLTVGTFAHDLLEKYFTVPAAARWADSFLQVAPPTAVDTDVERGGVAEWAAAQLPPLPRYVRAASITTPKLAEKVKDASAWPSGADAMWTLGDLAI